MNENVVNEVAEVPAFRKPRRGAKTAMRLFGAVREGHGGPMPPLDSWATPTLYLKEDGVTRVFSMTDDGGYVGIGYPDEWQVMMRWRAARLFAWWVLRQHARNWFGLRSALYFRALHAYCSGSWGRLGTPRRRLTRTSSHDEWWASRAGAPVETGETK